jgi:hypothetical protein
VKHGARSQTLDDLDLERFRCACNGVLWRIMVLISTVSARLGKCHDSAKLTMYIRAKAIALREADRVFESRAFGSGCGDSSLKARERLNAGKEEGCCSSKSLFARMMRSRPIEVFFLLDPCASSERS